MSNKDLLKQYVQVINNLNEYQFNKLPNNLKKTYTRQAIIRYNNGTKPLDYYIYDYLSDKEKNDLVTSDIENSRIINNRQVLYLVDNKSNALINYLTRLILMGDEIRHTNVYPSLSLSIIDYYVDKLNKSDVSEFITYIIKREKNLSYHEWFDIKSVLDDLDMSLNLLVKEYLNNGGSLGSNELSAITMYNINPIYLIDLLGKDKYKKILTNDKLLSGLTLDKWKTVGYNVVELNKIISLLNLSDSNDK